jgi:hypothetical protein
MDTSELVIKEDPGVSQFIKEDSAINGNWHIPFEDGANKQLALLFVSTTNTIPTLVWPLLYILCDTSLAKELTNEISKLSSPGRATKWSSISQSFHRSVHCLSLRIRRPCAFRTCKLGLVSLWKKRYSHIHPTTVQNSASVKCVIPKGAMVQMPSGVLHKDTKTWGSDALEFDTRRFLKSKTSDIESNQQEKQQRRAYNAFGGGKHLCPGRHVAFAEILGTVAMLLLGFDIVAPEGMSLTVPKRRYRLGEGVAKPDGRQGEAMDVRVRRKQGWEKVKWTFDVGSLDK